MILLDLFPILEIAASYVYMLHAFSSPVPAQNQVSVFLAFVVHYEYFSHFDDQANLTLQPPREYSLSL